MAKTTIDELIDAVESLQQDVERYHDIVEEYKGQSRRTERALEIHEVNTHHHNHKGNDDAV